MVNLTDKKKVFAWAAAACFAVCFLASLVPSVHFIRENGGLIVMTAVMNLITYPGLAFTVFRKDKKGVMTVACVQFAANLLVLLINLGPSFSDLIPVFRMAAYALLAFAAIRSGLENGRIGWLWFLPGVFGLASLAVWAGQSWFPDFFQSFMEMGAYDWVYAVAETAALFLAGLWLKNDPTRVRISVS